MWKRIAGICNVQQLVIWDFKEVGKFHLGFSYLLEWDFSSEQQPESFGQFNALISGLRACSSSRDLQNGLRIHSDASKWRIDSNIFVANTLVDMYGKCGRMVEANRVFESLQSPNVVSWTSLMLGYVENRQEEMALECFHRMQRYGSTPPNARAFVAALKACSSLAKEECRGKVAKVTVFENVVRIHAQARRLGCDSDAYVACTLIDSYANCGRMAEAREVFERMVEKVLVAWNALIMGYVENDEARLGLEMFRLMRIKGCRPNSRSFVAALKACGNLALDCDDGVKAESLEMGRALHCEADEVASDDFLAAVVVEMYVKCGSLVEARRVFEKAKLHTTDVVIWNVLILGYAENGEGDLGWELFSRLQSEGCVRATVTTFVAVVKAIAALAGKDSERVVKVECLERVMVLHSLAENSGWCVHETFFTSCLIDVYGKCGSMVDARRVFDKMSVHDVVAWTALILGYVENCDAYVAWDLFTYFARAGQEIDAGILVAALKACTVMAAGVEISHAKVAEDKKVAKSETALKRGVFVHALAAELGHESGLFVASSLVAMYVRCGSLVNARAVFDRMPRRDGVAWTALMLGYAENGDGEAAAELLARLRELTTNSKLEAPIYIPALKLCFTNLGLVKETVAEIYRSGLENDLTIATCALDAYGRCGSVVNARLVFDCL